MKKYALWFEQVPDECQRVNLRSILPKELWDVVRKDAYARAGHVCSVCGARGRLEAHERWTYDEKAKVQKLSSVVALCRACHEVVHIGRTSLIGRYQEAMEHFMRVNGCTQSEFHLALERANAEHERLNRVEEWATDLSWLKRFT